MKRIAVWNTAFLGDAVLTLPLIQSLAAAYPEAALDFYVRGGFAPLFADHPALRQVIAYDKRGRQRGVSAGVSFAQQIKLAHYDLFVCAHTSVRSGALARFSGAPVRIGYRETPGSGLWFAHAVSRRFGELHEIERLLALLEPLGVPPVTAEPRLYLPKDARNKAEEAFSAFSFPVLGVHPGSVWETKRWPADYFAAVAAKAMEAGAGVMLLAGPSELAQAQEVRFGIESRVSPELLASRFIDCAGTLSLVELAAYIGRLSHYLTNDSGPMHIAWCQEVPVTAIFGPTTETLGFFPRGKYSQVAELSLECRPCGLHGGHVCPQKHHNCMVQLLPEAVWPMVKKYLLP